MSEEFSTDVPMISFVASVRAALNQTDLLSASCSKLWRDKAFSGVSLLLNDSHQARSFYIMLCTVTFFSLSFEEKKLTANASRAFMCSERGSLAKEVNRQTDTGKGTSIVLR